MSETPQEYRKTTNEEADKRLHKRGLIGRIKPSLGRLRQRFGCPPFSVLNARDGLWQQRKRAWIGLGIKSEEGRTQEGPYHLGKGGGTLLEYTSDTRKRGRKLGTCGENTRQIQRGEYIGFDGKPNTSGKGSDCTSGTSVFDPVLCELIYNWWCPLGGIVVDPFAGGSVRGIVASVLGLKYWGCELRPEQVEANKRQLTEVIRGRYKPRWVCGDSTDELFRSPRADFLFSCPPYGNLEKYSEDPRDLSNMSYEDFLSCYEAIVDGACKQLKDHRFACFVVANYRDCGTRMTRNFVGDTIVAFEKAGLDFYTEAVLVTSVGSAAMRVEGTFVRGKRKLVRTHQNVLVFIKGSPKRAVSVIEGN